MRTRVGYAGGSTPSPTYHDLADHTESVEVDFDPTRTSYRELLRVFWESHDPTRRAWSRQYQSFVFVHGPEQERAARETKAEVEARLGRPVLTEVVAAGPFHRAEHYHQKYSLQHLLPALADFDAMYPGGAFVDSTAAARVNGYLAGYGTPAELRAELPQLGLSSAAGAALLRIVEESAGR